MDILLFGGELRTDIANYIGSNEALFSVILSTLLVLLYLEQYKLQETQEELIQRQTEISEATENPILFIKRVSITKNNMSLYMENIGNGPALNMHLFLYSGEYKSDNEFFQKETAIENKTPGVNTISESDGTDQYITELSYRTFNTPVGKAGQSISIENLTSEQLNATRPERAEMKLCFMFTDITGRKKFEDLFEISGDPADCENFEDYLGNSNITVVSTNSSNVVMSDYWKNNL
ncbi:hypothetical protein [Halorubrum sp. AS12]|uniref:hypothetical protein n=1 Tax=Halorubrum sp. AS12 TaxID=3409687 RepID=UPI003DA6E93B